MLQALESELHKPATCSDATRLDVLLHADLREVGRSGVLYAKADILSRLPEQASQVLIVADHFELRRLGELVALLTYRSAQQLPDGTLDRFSLRSSVWEHSMQGWQISFHQGTPTAPFELFKLTLASARCSMRRMP